MARRKIDFNFTKQLLADYLATERQAKNNQAIQEREAALQRSQQEQALFLAALKDPSLIKQLLRGGRSQLGGMNLSQLAPTPASQLQSGYNTIGNAKNLSELPDEATLQGMLGDINTDVAPLMQALAARRASLEREAPVTVLEGYDPKTQMPYREGFRSRDLPGQRIQTGPTPMQAGENKVTEAAFGELSPDMTNNKIQAANRIESGTRPEKVRTAGAEAGAQAAARAGVEYDPKNMASRIYEFGQKAQIEAALAGNREAAKAADEAARTATTAQIALSQIKEKYDAVKLGTGGATVGDKTRALGRSAVRSLPGELSQGTMQVVNPAAAELDRLAGGYAMLLYRAFGGTGANVSDKDVAFMLGAIPNSATLADVGDEVFTNTSMLLTFAPMISARYGKLPFEERFTIGKQWSEAYKKAQAAGATQFEDPASPGKFVPVRPR